MLDFSKFTVDNLAVKSLKDLIAEITFKSDNWDAIVTHVPGAQNGKKVGFIGKMAPVGTPSAGCKPTYVAGNISGAEKTWAMGQWEVPLTLCYTDLIGTIAQYTLKKGTEIGDLTGGEYYTEILVPKLAEAMNDMIWRLGWFGNTAAENVTDGGVITNTVASNLFTTLDGFWKRLFAIATTDPTQKTAIAANAEATLALQKSKLLVSGVARGIFDKLILDADPMISGQPGAGIFATKSLADALYYDLQHANLLMQPWQTLFAGFDVSSYNGVPIYRVAEWDVMIQQFENNGTTYNLPHRAVYTFPGNLLLGTDGTDPVSDVDFFFDRKDRSNYIYATGTMGTRVLHDNMVQVAY